MMQLISTKNVSVATDFIEWTDIPQTGKDLLILFSARSTSSNGETLLMLNGAGGGGTYNLIHIRGTGSAVTSGNAPDNNLSDTVTDSNFTANAFSATRIYVANYAVAQPKRIMVDTAIGRDSATGGLRTVGMRWSSTASITSIRLEAATANFAVGTTASLYLIGEDTTPRATGGVIMYKDNYFYHIFTSSGTFTPTEAISADILVVGGGGSGGSGNGGSGGGGGGGAGAVKYSAAQALSATSYVITIGAGGASQNGGSASTFGSTFQTGYVISGGGGGGAVGNFDNGGQNGVNGSSGGGGSGLGGYLPGGTGSSPGTNGGTGDSSDGGGGGGGAGAAGANGTATAGGAGGDGVNTYSSLLADIQMGVLSGGTRWIGGGGGGAPDSTTDAIGPGGRGGGGSATRTSGNSGASGTINTGGGGGGSYNAAGGAGGSGLVIVRYAV